MARVFNGSSQYLSNTSFATMTFPCTISAWFWTTNSGALQRVASIANGSGHVLASLLVNYGGAGTIAAQMYDGSINAFSTASGVGLNTWHHAAAVVESNGVTMYLDVAAATKTTYSGPSISGMSLIQVGYYPGTQYLNGREAFLAIHSAALAADEIASLGQKLNGVPCGVHPSRIRPESLVACWPLGGFDGDHDGDIWANAYNLTAYNSPTWDESPAVLYSAGPLWLPAFTISSSDRTAAISGTMGAMSASLSAGFTKPTYTASIAGTQAPMTAALGATRTLPTFAASIAASHAAMSASLAASFTKPAYSATIGATHAPMAASLGAAFGDPEFIASIAASHAPMSAAVSATFDEPTYTASIAGTLGAMTSTVSATSATEIDTASIVATMGAMTASLTAVYSDIVYVTTDCGIVPHFTRSTVPRFRRRNIVASIRRNTVPRFRRARR